MTTFIDRARVKPFIRKAFEFPDAKAAYAAHAVSDIFGKIAI
ncbi:MAG: hypothetical protein QM605_12930 [Sphingobium sp.]